MCNYKAEYHEFVINIWQDIIFFNNIIGSQSTRYNFIYRVHTSDKFCTCTKTMYSLPMIMLWTIPRIGNNSIPFRRHCNQLLSMGQFEFLLKFTRAILRLQHTRATRTRGERVRGMNMIITDDEPMDLISLSSLGSSGSSNNWVNSTLTFYLRLSIETAIEWRYEDMHYGSARLPPTNRICV